MLISGARVEEGTIGERFIGTSSCTCSDAAGDSIDGTINERSSVEVDGRSDVTASRGTCSDTFPATFCETVGGPVRGT